MPAGLLLRPAVDIPELMKWRAEVLLHVFGAEPGSELMEANRRYYARHAAEGTHLAFIAEDDGEECGCGGVCFSEELPSPDNPSGRCAYLMNIYVREPFRKRGVAHAIVGRLIDESRRRGCGKIYLETTAEGRPVYLSAGFRDLPGMMKLTDEL